MFCKRLPWYKGNFWTFRPVQTKNDKIPKFPHIDFFRVEYNNWDLISIPEFGKSLIRLRPGNIIWFSCFFFIGKCLLSSVRSNYEVSQPSVPSPPVEPQHFMAIKVSLLLRPFCILFYIFETLFFLRSETLILVLYPSARENIWTFCQSVSFLKTIIIRVVSIMDEGIEAGWEWLIRASKCFLFHKNENKNLSSMSVFRSFCFVMNF